ncbi:COX15/CtaA family protein [Glycomyces tenuis]|uniref:COX15/CtaA family protein n=1 Tax=Glycomyces tenuis TaxID=58116 RepID=UPI000407DF14|nr:COX15/CtaA family protein [Glycomyces tenuis]
MNLFQRWFAQPGAVRRWALVSLIANVVIIVTGGAVRLTESGLGCAEWPKCTEQSLVATPEMGVHGAIEFGNRLLGGIVVALAVAALLAAWKRAPRRTSLVKLALWVVLLAVSQAVIGGISVWTGLNSWIVGLHFVVSMVILVLALALYLRSGEPDGPARPLVPHAVALLGRAVVSAAAVVILLGVVVTGSGPHAGDEDTPRNGLDPELMSQLHADGVWLLIGLSVALVFTLHAVKASESARRAAHVLVAVELLQGLIGYVQYYTDLPEVLVGMHMLGASLLWISVIAVVFALRRRVPAESREPQRIVVDPGPEAPTSPVPVDTEAAAER